MAESPPTRIKIRKGIIKNISDDLTADEIKKNYETVPPNLPLIFARRLKKRNKVLTEDNSEKWVASNSFVLSFVNELPTEISIYKVKVKVAPFVPRPLQCFTCFKFEHTNKYCKSKPVCIKCSAEKHEGDCAEPTLKCVNCSGPHQSIDSACPMYAKYKKLYTHMAHENLSFSDAKKKVFGESDELAGNKENIATLVQNVLEEFKNIHANLREVSVSNLQPQVGDGSTSSSSETLAENAAQASANGKKGNNKKKKKKGKSKKRRNF